MNVLALRPSDKGHRSGLALQLCENFLDVLGTFLTFVDVFGFHFDVDGGFRHLMFSDVPNSSQTPRARHLPRSRDKPRSVPWKS